MSVTATAKRRRRQFAIGHRHLAVLCGKSVRGGRPIYPPQKTRSVQDAIQRERAMAQRQQSIKRKKS